MDPAFPARLRSLRRGAGLTQRQLASRVGVHPVLLSQWETGRCDPPFRRKLELARELGVSSSDVLGTPEMTVRR